MYQFKTVMLKVLIRQGKINYTVVSTKNLDMHQAKMVLVTWSYLGLED